MDTFVIRGGNRLHGTLTVNGSKNAALKAFAAALLTSQPVRLSNVPEVEDVARIIEMLRKLGVVVRRLRQGTYSVIARHIEHGNLDPDTAKRIRASIVLTGPLLARTGAVSFPYPGGCVIGKRPIDVFEAGYRAFGARLHERKGMFHVAAKRLIGTTFFFGTVSVTGTETLMMTAVLAEGTTVLKNCACEPDVEELSKFLNACGAKISGAGSPTITIHGVRRLSGGSYSVMPDRIEAGTFLILAAATGNRLTVDRCIPGHLDSVLDVLRKMGVRFRAQKNSLTVIPPKRLTAVSVKTREYPGFPTDLQAPVCVLQTQAEGRSLIHETIYEGRLYWTEELKRMGADVRLFDPHRLEIQGPTALRGRDIESPDIRAGMAFIIAALCTRGTSTINDAYQIDRGYERIEERLKAVGASIRRVRN